MKSTTFVPVLAALAVPATAAPFWARQEASSNQSATSSEALSATSSSSGGSSSVSPPSATMVPVPSASGPIPGSGLCAEDYVFGKLVCEQLKWTPIGICCTVPPGQGLSGPVASVSASFASRAGASASGSFSAVSSNATAFKPSATPEPYSVTESAATGSSTTDSSATSESTGASPTDNAALAANVQVDQDPGNLAVGVESSQELPVEPPTGGSNKDQTWCWGTGCDQNGGGSGNTGGGNSGGVQGGQSSTASPSGGSKGSVNSGAGNAFNAGGNPDLPFASDTTEIKADMTAADKDGSSEVSKMMLDYHNQFRAQYGAPALTWDAQRGDEAAGYMSACDNSHHGPSNLHWATNMLTVHSTMDGWADEAKDYDHNAATFASGTGHFTQMVWKSATKLGCGWKLGCNGQGSISFICLYDQGNMMGEFKENVGQKQ